MKSNYQLRKWLAKEVLGKDIPRKPPKSERRGPARNSKYRAFVRSFPCAACGSTYRVECAHVGDDGGTSMKCSDYATIPLCAKCHRTGPGAYHGLNTSASAFIRKWKLDIPSLVARLNAAYRAMRAGAA